MWKSNNTERNSWYNSFNNIQVYQTETLVSFINVCATRKNFKNLKTKNERYFKGPVSLSYRTQKGVSINYVDKHRGGRGLPKCQ